MVDCSGNVLGTSFIPDGFDSVKSVFSLSLSLCVSASDGSSSSGFGTRSDVVCSTDFESESLSILDVVSSSLRSADRSVVGFCVGVTVGVRVPMDWRSTLLTDAVDGFVVE